MSSPDLFAAAAIGTGAVAVPLIARKRWKTIGKHTLNANQDQLRGNKLLSHRVKAVSSFMDVHLGPTEAAPNGARASGSRALRSGSTGGSKPDNPTHKLLSSWNQQKDNFSPLIARFDENEEEGGEQEREKTLHVASPMLVEAEKQMEDAAASARDAAKSAERAEQAATQAEARSEITFVHEHHHYVHHREDPLPSPPQLPAPPPLPSNRAHGMLPQQGVVIEFPKRQLPKLPSRTQRRAVGEARGSDTAIVERRLQDSQQREPRRQQSDNSDTDALSSTLSDWTDGRSSFEGTVGAQRIVFKPIPPRDP